MHTYHKPQIFFRAILLLVVATTALLLLSPAAFAGPRVVAEGEVATQGSVFDVLQTNAINYLPISRWGDGVGAFHSRVGFSITSPQYYLNVQMRDMMAGFFMGTAAFMWNVALSLMTKAMNLSPATSAASAITNATQGMARGIAGTEGRAVSLFIIFLVGFLLWSLYQYMRGVGRLFSGLLSRVVAGALLFLMATKGAGEVGSATWYINTVNGAANLISQPISALNDAVDIEDSNASALGITAEERDGFDCQGFLEVMRERWDGDGMIQGRGDTAMAKSISDLWEASMLPSWIKIQFGISPYNERAWCRLLDNVSNVPVTGPEGTGSVYVEAAVDGGAQGAFVGGGSSVSDISPSAGTSAGVAVNGGPGSGALNTQAAINEQRAKQKAEEAAKAGEGGSSQAVDTNAVIRGVKSAADLPQAVAYSGSVMAERSAIGIANCYWTGSGWDMDRIEDVYSAGATSVETEGGKVCYDLWQRTGGSKQDDRLNAFNFPDGPDGSTPSLSGAPYRFVDALQGTANTGSVVVGVTILFGSLGVFIVFVFLGVLVIASKVMMVGYALALPILLIISLLPKQDTGGKLKKTFMSFIGFGLVSVVAVAIVSLICLFSSIIIELAQMGVEPGSIFAIMLAGWAPALSAFILSKIAVKLGLPNFLSVGGIKQIASGAKNFGSGALSRGSGLLSKLGRKATGGASKLGKKGAKSLMGKLSGASKRGTGRFNPMGKKGGEAPENAPGGIGAESKAMADAGAEKFKEGLKQGALHPIQSTKRVVGGAFRGVRQRFANAVAAVKARRGFADNKRGTARAVGVLAARGITATPEKIKNAARRAAVVGAAGARMGGKAAAWAAKKTVKATAMSAAIIAGGPVGWGVAGSIAARSIYRRVKKAGGRDRAQEHPAIDEQQAQQRPKQQVPPDVRRKRRKTTQSSSYGNAGRPRGRKTTQSSSYGNAGRPRGRQGRGRR